MLRGWIKSEPKLRAFVQNVDSDVGLNRKRVRYSTKPELDKALATRMTQRER